MDYPLNLQLLAPAVGFAVANDEAEHIALTEHGYHPAFVAPAVAEKPAAKKAAVAEKPAAKEPAAE